MMVLLKEIHQSNQISTRLMSKSLPEMIPIRQIKRRPNMMLMMRMMKTLQRRTLLLEISKIKFSTSKRLIKISRRQHNWSHQ